MTGNDSVSEVRTRVAGYGYPYKLCIRESLPDLLKRYALACRDKEGLRGMQKIPVALTVVGAKRFLIEIEDAASGDAKQAEQIQVLLADGDYVLSREAEDVLCRRLEELKEK